MTREGAAEMAGIPAGTTLAYPEYVSGEGDDVQWGQRQLRVYEHDAKNARVTVGAVGCEHDPKCVCSWLVAASGNPQRALLVNADRRISERAVDNHCAQKESEQYMAERIRSVEAGEGDPEYPLCDKCKGGTGPICGNCEFDLMSFGEREIYLADRAYEGEQRQKQRKEA